MKQFLRLIVFAGLVAGNILCAGAEEWPQVFADDFNRGGVLGVDYLQGDWIIKGGKWDVAGELKGIGQGAVIMCARRFQVPFRIEYECSSDNPGDLSVQINGALDDKSVLCWVGFGCDYNTRNKIATPIGGEVFSRENLIEPGRRHKVVVEVMEASVRQIIDGKDTLKAEVKLPKKSLYFGFSIWNPGSFRNVKVYSPNPAGKMEGGDLKAAAAPEQSVVREFKSFEDWPVGKIAATNLAIAEGEKCSVRIADVPTWLYYNLKDRIYWYKENEDPAKADEIMKSLPNQGAHFVSDHCLELSSENTDGKTKASVSFPVPPMKNGLVEFDLMADSCTGDALRIKMGDKISLFIDKDGKFNWESGGRTARLAEKIQYHGIHSIARFYFPPRRWFTVRIDFDTGLSLANAVVVNLYCYEHYGKGGVNQYFVLGEDLPLPADTVSKITFETAGAGRFFIDNLFFLSRTPDLADDAKWKVAAKEIMKPYYHQRKDPLALDTWSLRNARNCPGAPRGDEMGDLQRTPEKYAVIIESAKQYNKILIEQAFLAEKLRGLERAFFYCSSGNETIAGKFRDRIQEARQGAAETKRLLADLYRFYADCYLDSLNQAKMKEGFAPKYDNLKSAVAKSEAAIQSLYQDMTADSAGKPGDIACRYEPGKSASPLTFSDGSYRRDGKRVYWCIGGEKNSACYADEQLLLLSCDVNGTPAEWFLGKDYGKEGEPNFCLDNTRVAHYLNKVPQGVFTINTRYGIHYLQSLVPVWWIEKHKDDPDIFMRNYKGDTGIMGDDHSCGWIMNYWHPEVLAAHKAFLQGVIDVIAGYSNGEWKKRVNYVDMAAEAQFRLPNKEGLWEMGYNRTAVKAFQGQLKKEYGSIGALNERWKSKYGNFDEIQPPEDYNLKPRLIPSGLAYEFEKFRQESWHGWQKQCAQWIQEKLAQRAAFSVDHNCPMLAGQDAIDGFEPVEMFETFDIVMEHAQQQFADDPGVFRYLENLRQVFNSTTGSGEWYVAGPDDVFNEEAVMNNGLRQAYQCVQWGRSMLTYWGGMGLYWITGGCWSEPRLGHTVFRYSANYVPLSISRARAHQRIYLDCPLVQPGLGIVESETSFYNVMNVRGGLREFSSLLFAKGHDFGFLFERLIMDGRQKLDNYKVLILPNALSLPADFTQKILAWVEKGGTLIATGPVGVWNEYGRTNGLILDKVIGKGNWACQGRIFRLSGKLPGNGAVKVLYQKDASFLVEGKHGQGRVIIRQGSVSPEMVYGLISTTAPRKFYGKDSRFHLVMRQGQKGTWSQQLLKRFGGAGGGCLYLSVLNPDCYQTLEDEIVLKGEYKDITDISCNFPITPQIRDGMTSFKLSLAPAEGVMIRIQR